MRSPVTRESSPEDSDSNIIDEAQAYDLWSKVTWRPEGNADDDDIPFTSGDNTNTDPPDPESRRADEFEVEQDLEDELDASELWGNLNDAISAQSIEVSPRTDKGYRRSIFTNVQSCVVPLYSFN